MSNNRIHNFNAGPAALPEEVLLDAQQELLNFSESGMSVMELSHRSSIYENIHEQAKQSVKELLSIEDDYEVLFLQGGASHQFAMVPYNFLPAQKKANYILTGSWSEKAQKEASMIGETYAGGSSKSEGYRKIPAFHEISTSPEDAYVHLTSNNTIYGTAWQRFDQVSEWAPPVIADMSSDLLSRPLPVSHFDLIYAGAQKNLGPSGVTIVIAKKSYLASSRPQAETLPQIMRYLTHEKANSLYNTPPTFAIYMMERVLQWIKNEGGLITIGERNAEKASMIYRAIDESQGFYSGHSDRESRSLMNVTWTLPSEELTNQFLAKANEQRFSGLKGHRSVGGCRASIYNAVSLQSCEVLHDFMIDFAKNH